MALYVNQTAAPVFFKVGPEILVFLPGILTTVSKDQEAVLKKTIPLWKRMLDEGGIVTGTKAKKLASETEKELEMPLPDPDEADEAD